MPENVIFNRYYREKIRPVLEGGGAKTTTAKVDRYVG
jgi:hypothetical protein